MHPHNKSLFRLLPTFSKSEKYSNEILTIETDSCLSLNVLEDGGIKVYN